MPDDADITVGHPSAHLRPAPDPEPASAPPPLSAVFPAEVELGHDTVHYGPGLPTEADLRLLGHPEGKRIVVLGASQAAVHLATRGAHVIAVDPSHRRLDRVRTACEAAEVRVELHQSDLAELPFVRADTVDTVLSVYALASVADLDRAFRQAHRVLRTGGHLAVSLPHPAFALVDPTGDPRRIARRWFDHSPLPWRASGETGEEHVRSVSELFTSLARANFRVDTVLEPQARPGGPLWSEAMAWVPPTLILRARKEGI
jgi:SAM-dependent methyltransferase